MKKFFKTMFMLVTVFMALFVVNSVNIKGATVSVVDEIKHSSLKATGTSYTNFTGVTFESDAEYAGNSALNNKVNIQLRSSGSNSGIVTTKSGGNVKKITLEWASNTSKGRTIDVYGKNTAYSAASDLYNSASRGTKLGSIVYGTSTELAITGDYGYIGIRSNSGALYLSSIKVEWEYEVNESQTYYDVTFDPDNGEEPTVISVQENATTSALDPEPQKSGYSFLGWYNGDTPFDFNQPITNGLTLTAKWEEIHYNKFVKITSLEELTDGKYIIAYENQVFNSSLEDLDISSNYVETTGLNDYILDQSVIKVELSMAFDITTTTEGSSIKSSSNYYIGQTSDANGLKSSEDDDYTNTISFNEDGTVNIVSGGAYLRFNATSGQERFRYYKSTTYTAQKAIYLYKLVEEHETNESILQYQYNSDKTKLRFIGTVQSVNTGVENEEFTTDIESITLRLNFNSKTVDINLNVIYNSVMSGSTVVKEQTDNNYYVVFVLTGISEYLGEQMSGQLIVKYNNGTQAISEIRTFNIGEEA